MRGTETSRMHFHEGSAEMHSGWDGIRGFAKAILQEAFGQSYSKPVGHGPWWVLRGDPDGANIGVAQMVLGGAEDFSTDSAKGVAWTRVNISQDAETTERAADLGNPYFLLISLVKLKEDATGFGQMQKLKRKGYRLAAAS